MLRRFAITVCLILGMYMNTTSSIPQSNVRVIASITLTAERGSILATASYINTELCPEGICDVLALAAYLYSESCRVDTAVYKSIIGNFQRNLDALEKDTLKSNGAIL